MINQNDKTDDQGTSVSEQPKGENVLLNWIIVVTGLAATMLVAGYFAGGL